MPSPWQTAVDGLARAAPRFDAPAHADKHAALQRLSKLPLRADALLLRYHDLLLFLRAHPSDARLLAAVEGELARLAAFLRERRGDVPDALHNQGLPFADTVTRFTHDCVRRLLDHPHGRVTPDACIDASFDLNAVLRLTLPSLERGSTTAGLDNDGLLDALGLPARARLRFIVDQLARLDDQPLIKDTLFDALGLYVRLRPTQRRLSKAYNRLPMDSVFFQTKLHRDFDSLALMNRRLPAQRRLDAAARAQVIGTLQDTLTLTCRETDTATYIDARSLFVVDLERGLSVAVYGMTAERQLPLDAEALIHRAFAVFGPAHGQVQPELALFLRERLVGYLRELGYSAQEVDAVTALRPPRWAELPQRLAAVRSFAALPEAPALASANKRVGNILKKVEGELPSVVDEALLAEPAERALAAALAAAAPLAEAAFERGDYTASLQALALLKSPVDAFFDSVMVNADDLDLRRNRLALLSRLKQAMNQVADLSRLAV